MTWRRNNCKVSHGHMSPAVYQGQCEPDCNPNAQNLMNFKKVSKEKSLSTPS